MSVFDLGNKGLKPFQNVMVGVFGVLAVYYVFVTATLSLPFLNILYETAPFWLTYMLFPEALELWLDWRRELFLHEAGHKLIEIKLPKEITKSPAAMEVALTALYQTGSATYVETFWKGKVKPWFSFEMISEDGHIRFFIWTHTKFKDLVESQIYSQYPGVEIHDVPDNEDYVHKVQHDPENLPIWGTYFKLTKPNPYPIKTYIDYGLGDNPKEEHKVDPMTSVLEYMGSLRKGESVWFQIMFQAHKAEGLKEGHLHEKHFWKHEAEHLVNEILQRDPHTKAAAVVPETGVPTRPIQSQDEKDAAAAIERKVAKWPFETCIRAIYISTKEAFNPVSITGLIGSFRQYSTQNLNEIKLAWYTDFDYPWQDIRRVRRNRAEIMMLDAYKRRSFFQGPYRYFHQGPFILNTEELATIYHFPGEVAGTPTLPRIPSKKVAAPGNLPL